MGDKKKEEKKVKKRFSMVLALAMVFSLVFSSVAMAAPEGTQISNELELTVTVEEEVEMGTIKVNDDLATISVKGLWDVFSVSTQPPEGYSGNVKGKVEVVNSNINGFKLEYLEQGRGPNHGKFFEMTFDNNEAYFGPAEGFPWQVVDDSMFRVTWEEEGTYNFTLSIMGGEDFGTVLASDTVTVEVAEGNAMALAHATAGAGEVASIKNPQELFAKINELSPVADPATYTVNEVGGKFDYVVVADLDNNVSHVDNVLFVFEVAKDGGDITKGDFEITAISLRDDTEGINETFVVEEGKLKGFWGPPKGLLFAGQAATAFTVKFNAEGTYTVNTYAIQVAPTARADL